MNNTHIKENTLNTNRVSWQNCACAKWC